MPNNTLILNIILHNFFLNQLREERKGKVYIYIIFNNYIFTLSCALCFFVWTFIAI